MYEAPDRYKRMIAARLPDGESLGVTSRDEDAEGSPLRDVQLISRAHLAPFFAAANVVAAMMIVAALWSDVAPALLLPWAAAVERLGYTPDEIAAMRVQRRQEALDGAGVAFDGLLGEAS